MNVQLFAHRLFPHRGTPVDDSAAQALAAVVGPDSVDVAARHLRLGLGFCATFAAVGYPATVTAPWLEPILSWPGRLDVAVHIEPISNATAAAQLRRSRAKLESSRRIDAGKGRLGDPGVDAAAEDAADLADRIARGAAKLVGAVTFIALGSDGGAASAGLQLALKELRSR